MSPPTTLRGALTTLPRRGDPGAVSSPGPAASHHRAQRAASLARDALFWTFIPAIIAFVEFIVLLVMSDEEFATKYGGA